MLKNKCLNFGLEKMMYHHIKLSRPYWKRNSF